MQETSRPIVHLALYEEVANRLRDRIYDESLVPGEWIDEKGICDQLGISRTPLREALKVLCAEGLVELVPRRGCQVKQFEPEEFRELFPVVAVLEGLSARLAALHMSDEQQRELEAMHGELEDFAATGLINEYYEQNIRVHEAISRYANNKWLRRVVQDLRKVLRLARHHQLNAPGRLKESLSEHRAVMQALKDRDPVRADRLMQQHLMEQWQALSETNQGMPTY